MGAARALLRRAVGRQRRPAWSLGMEALVSVTKRGWSVMPRIGVVRWRNVGERMSPIKVDGLAPRFIQAGQVEGAWIEPPGADVPVLLYFHGGGFVFGSLRTHGMLIGALARAAKARTFALSYRLGPEHAAHAAQEDAIAAYNYLLAEGIDPKRIVLAGDSAGGTIALLQKPRPPPRVRSGSDFPNSGPRVAPRLAAQHAHPASRFRHAPSSGSGRDFSLGGFGLFGGELRNQRAVRLRREGPLPPRRE